jgi:hypothetical protein
MNNAAADRKKRFLALKAQAGGAESLMQIQKNQPYRVYFDQHGEITCITKTEIEPDPAWLTHDFAQDQIDMLKSGTSKFVVVQDARRSGSYSIQQRVASSCEPAITEFLTEIELTHDADVYCNVFNNMIKISVSDQIRELYRDTDPQQATVKGQRTLSFFITGFRDPHVLYEKHHVPLCNLLTVQEICIQLESDYENYSIYTLKLFDKYSRITRITHNEN